LAFHAAENFPSVHPRLVLLVFPQMNAQARLNVGLKR